MPRQKTHPVPKAAGKARDSALITAHSALVKSVARRPKGLFRPDKVHRDETAYSRRKAKAELKKALKNETERNHK